MTRFDMRCPGCGHIEEIAAPFGATPTYTCTQCGQQMKQYFGKRNEMLINQGFRPQNYSNKTDRDIANFQFTNL